MKSYLADGLKDAKGDKKPAALNLLQTIANNTYLLKGQIDSNNKKQYKVYWSTQTGIKTGSGDNPILAKENKKSRF